MISVDQLVKKLNKAYNTSTGCWFTPDTVNALTMCLDNNPSKLNRINEVCDWVINDLFTLDHPGSYTYSQAQRIYIDDLKILTIELQQLGLRWESFDSYNIFKIPQVN